MCFRLLMEYHSFLFNDTSLYLKDFTSNFPSPCGVIFILTLLKFKDLYRNREKEEFPSPYRVSFILIIESVTNRLENPKFIFRLLMELYSFLLKNLRSDENDNKSFRLLTELYSFLLKKTLVVTQPDVRLFPSPYEVSFILTWTTEKRYNYTKGRFPSPYRVIFILTLCMKEFLIKKDQLRFRLLTELYSFLPHCLNLIRLGGRLVSVSLWSIIYSYKKGAE